MKSTNVFIVAQWLLLILLSVSLQSAEAGSRSIYYTVFNGVYAPGNYFLTYPPAGCWQLYLATKGRMPATGGE